MFVSFFNPFLLSIYHFPLSFLSVPPFLSVSHAAGPDFPRAGWTVVECVLLTFTRGQETQPPGRETRERGRERQREREREREWRMSQRGQGGTCRERDVDSKRTTSKISLATTFLRRLPVFFFMGIPLFLLIKPCWDVSALFSQNSPASLFLRLFSLFLLFLRFWSINRRQTPQSLITCCWWGGINKRGV